MKKLKCRLLLIAIAGSFMAFTACGGNANDNKAASAEESNLASNETDMEEEIVEAGSGVDAENSGEANDSESEETIEVEIAGNGVYEAGLTDSGKEIIGTPDDFGVVYKGEFCDDGVIVYGSLYFKGENDDRYVVLGDGARKIQTNETTIYHNAYGESISQEEFASLFEEGLGYYVNFGAEVKDGIATLIYVMP